MTYGRPSMTSHISPVPLPGMKPESQDDDPCELSEQPCDHRLGYMTFYVSTIELYKILESILSEIYNAWQSSSRHHRPMSPRGLKHKSLDVIMELDDKLSAYEANVPSVLNWTKADPPFNPNTYQGSVFQRQRNVLRARYFLQNPLYSLNLLTLSDSSTSASSFSALCSHNSAPKNAWAAETPAKIQTRTQPAPTKTSSTPPCP
jgi:hypothetical protein